MVGGGHVGWGMVGGRCVAAGAEVSKPTSSNSNSSFCDLPCCACQAPVTRGASARVDPPSAPAPARAALGSSAPQAPPTPLPPLALLAPTALVPRPRAPAVPQAPSGTRPSWRLPPARACVTLGDTAAWSGRFPAAARAHARYAHSSALAHTRTHRRAQPLIRVLTCTPILGHIALAPR